VSSQGLLEAVVGSRDESINGCRECGQDFSHVAPYATATKPKMSDVRASLEH
jgi:hypothetical protein